METNNDTYIQRGEKGLKGYPIKCPYADRWQTDTLKRLMKTFCYNFDIPYEDREKHPALRKLYAGIEEGGILSMTFIPCTTQYLGAEYLYEDNCGPTYKRVQEYLDKAATVLMLCGKQPKTQQPLLLMWPPIVFFVVGKNM